MWTVPSLSISRGALLAIRLEVLGGQASRSASRGLEHCMEKKTTEHHTPPLLIYTPSVSFYLSLDSVKLHYPATNKKKRKKYTDTPSLLVFQQRNTLKQSLALDFFFLKSVGFGLVTLSLVHLDQSSSGVAWIQIKSIPQSMPQNNLNLLNFLFG
jgi:hypothetical protein